MAQPAPLTVAPGKVRDEWCTACKAYTRITGELLLLTAAGVSTVGTWTWCEICDDPTDQQQEATRG